MNQTLIIFLLVVSIVAFVLFTRRKSGGGKFQIGDNVQALNGTTGAITAKQHDVIVGWQYQINESVLWWQESLLTRLQ